MPIETADDVWNEAQSEIPRSIAVIEFAIEGFARFAADVAGHPGSSTNPDPTVFIGDREPVHGQAYAWLKQSDMVRLSQGGVRVALTQSWIVSTFSRWEEDYRPRIAAALGLDKRRVRSDVFGELRSLRNDVVHHRGFATAKNAGRNSLLAFTVGGTISLDSDHFSAIIQNLVVMAVGDEVE